MMKQEFERVVGREVSLGDYEIIETVYMHYPGMDKPAVLKMYKTCGMLIFKDLLPRARQIQKLEQRIRELEAEKRQLQTG